MGNYEIMRQKLNDLARRDSCTGKWGRRVATMFLHEATHGASFASLHGRAPFLSKDQIEITVAFIKNASLFGPAEAANCNTGVDLRHCNQHPPANVGCQVLTSGRKSGTVGE